MINRKLKIIVVSSFSLLGILLLCGGLCFLEISSFIKTPPHPSAQATEFTITPGQSLKRIAKNLEKNAIISNQLYFIVFTKLKKAEKKLQAGEYHLSGASSPEQILEILTSGRVKLYRITIPEGLNINEIGDLMETMGGCNQKTFSDLCHDRSFAHSLGIKSTTLEGYLFPDTYFYPKQASCEDIIRTMVGHFNRIFTPKWQARAKTLGFSVHEIVILASMIEKETGDASERPLIASVFHNRLKKNMRLESDPTVIYGINDFDGNIKRKHLKMPTPYNTYQIKGLPQGPIANPGALSIQAALYPAPTKYLFFVSKKDTTHQFSRTLQEHNQAVKTYQLRNE
ncbi:endolytic transglycosylase MltG [Desulfobacula sp.]|uniref:endolytic transglycosylase MltG n=1 Tax=Desulfobacula sp. TaxID=2593537 RepID=UPI00261E6394|nr:endolytic transglycosylase MltG [Desulfobacula sp.]